MKRQYNVYYTLKMLGCFNPTLGQIWTNPTLASLIFTFLTQLWVQIV